MRNDLEELFGRYREHGDVRALAKVFDDLAPELLALALHLARSRDEAEDLVQATFLTAIESAKSFDERRALLPWLAGVLAMHARKLRERSGRAPVLADVEVLAKDDPVREASERELGLAVDRAVQSLPSNYASIVRRHIVDGARAPELAREFGVTEVNARTRLHRGLKLLRRALPIAFGGGAIAATRGVPRGIAAVRRVVLGNAARVAGVAVPAAGIPVALIVAALALPCVGAIALFETRASDDESGERSSSLTASLAETAGSAAAPIANAETDRREVDASVSTTNTPPPAAIHESADVVLRGHLLLPDGSPASGVTMSVNGWQSNDELVERYGLPNDWHDPEPSTSDADGRFELAFEPPRAFQFTLEAELPDFVIAEWRWGVLEPGSTVDVGDVTLERAGQLIVRVFDATGQALCDGWFVGATSDRDPAGEDREVHFSNTHCESGSGEFVLSDLPEGHVEVSASSQLGAQVTGEAICHAGETTELALAYVGPDLSKRIAVRLRDKLLMRSFPPDLSAITLNSFGMEPRTPQSENLRASGRCWFDGVAPGLYDVELNDPRYEPVSATVSPGEVAILELRGRAAVRLKLVSPSGDPLDIPYSLAARWPQPNTWNSDVSLHKRSEPLPSDGVYHGLLPGLAMQLTVTLDGGAKFDVDVPPLSANEIRDIERILDANLTIGGRVLATDGTTPSSGVTVELTRGPIAGHSGESGRIIARRTEIPRRGIVASTDSDGRFRFAAFANGTWTVRVRWGTELVVDRTVELARQAVDLEFVEPPHGQLVGRILLPHGVAISDLSLQAPPPRGDAAYLAPPELAMEMERFLEHDPARLHDDGTFELGPLPLGIRALSLRTWVALPNMGHVGSSVALGEFEVTEGTPTPHVIDVRDRFPGRVRAHCTVDGQAAPGMTIELRRIDGSQPPGVDGSSIAAVGMGIIGPAAPGSVRIVLSDRDKTWKLCAPNTIDIAPGADTPFELDIATYERSVLVVDTATEQPLANFSLGVWTGSCDVESKAVRTTDANGVLHLRMPELSVRFTSERNVADVIAPSLVGWPAAADPLVLRVSQ